MLNLFQHLIPRFLFLRYRRFCGLRPFPSFGQTGLQANSQNAAGLFSSLADKLSAFLPFYLIRSNQSASKSILSK